EEWPPFLSRMRSRVRAPSSLRVKFGLDHAQCWPTGRPDRDKDIDIKRALFRELVWCITWCILVPELHARNRLKMRCSEQGERWRDGFLNRGSGVRISPGLPLFSRS